MRVIAGKYRSRPLSSLPGLDIRPTSDRLRETLFNVLTAGNPSALEGTVWLDLYAGTGAVGIEALSRGAAMVHFVEDSARAAELIKKNLESLEIESGFRNHRARGRASVAEAGSRRRDCRFHFYRSALSDGKGLFGDVLNLLAQSSYLIRGLVIAEHHKKFDPGSEFGVLRRVRELKQGDAMLSFYRRIA